MHLGRRTRCQIRAALVPALAFVAIAALPAAAGADQNGSYGGGKVTVTVGPADAGTATVTATEPTAASSSESLPFTGGDVLTVAAIGAAAVVLGGLGARARRTRRA